MKWKHVLVRSARIIHWGNFDSILWIRKLRSSPHWPVSSLTPSTKAPASIHQPESSSPPTQSSLTPDSTFLFLHPELSWPENYLKWRITLFMLSDLQTDQVLFWLFILRIICFLMILPAQTTESRGFISRKTIKYFIVYKWLKENLSSDSKKIPKKTIQRPGRASLDSCNKPPPWGQTHCAQTPS